MSRQPVYKRLPKKDKRGETNLLHLTDKKGVYRLFENTKLVYIGSSTSNLYKTILRHFQKWKDSRQLGRISYKDQLGRKSYTYKVELLPNATDNEIKAKEYRLIKRYKPRDNKLKLYCNLDGSICESKLDLALEQLKPKKKKPRPKKKQPPKDDFSDVPF